MEEYVSYAFDYYQVIDKDEFIERLKVARNGLIARKIVYNGKNYYIFSRGHFAISEELYNYLNYNNIIWKNESVYGRKRDFVRIRINLESILRSSA